MSTQPPRRPNILFIQTDSHDGRVMGCMGHPAMGRATPNMDALAARGAIFPNMYSNNPICCPSRASMWSGQFTHHCEGWNNFKGLSPVTPTFRTRLDAAGYLTHTIGKTDYLSGAHTIRARVSPWTRSACIARPAYRDHPPLVRDEDGPCVHKGDWQKVDDGLAWLRDVAAPADQPWMLYVGISLPHPGFTTSGHYLSMIDESGVTVPPADERDHPVMRYMRAVKNWEHGCDEEMIKAVRRVYFGMVAETDAMVGRLLGGLDELGLAEDTIVIFTSDHGECAMEHNQWYKMNLYEPAVRVPLIVAGCGIPAGRRVEALASLVDIYPTLTDMAGIDHPDGLDGHSLMDELAGGSGARPDWVFAEFHDSSCCTGAFSLRRGDWKLIEFVGYEPMLFDLAADPWEVRNLAPSRPEVLADMRRRMAAVTDIAVVDAKVKAYDRDSFRVWRFERQAAGDYEALMARIHSGWDDVSAEDAQPWTAEDEDRIEHWLAGEVFKAE